MIRAVIHSDEPAAPTRNIRDVYVLPYGSSRWTIKIKPGLCLKLYRTEEEAIEAAWIQARNYGSEVYLEDLKGQTKKAKLIG